MNLKIQNLMDTSGVDNMVQGITGAAAGLAGTLGGGTGAPASPGVGVSPQVQSMAQNAAGIPAWEGRYKIG